MPDARKANLPRGKDLITIGIFSAIYFVLNFICLLAEAARAMGKYRGAKANTAAFALFSLGMTGSPPPIWIMRGSFLAQIRAQGMV